MLNKIHPVKKCWFLFLLADRIKVNPEKTFTLAC